MYSVKDDPKGPGSPIRTSSDQSLFTAPRGFSQRTTSFIASQRQGIPRMLFWHLICLEYVLRGNKARIHAPGKAKALPADHHLCPMIRTDKPPFLTDKRYTEMYFHKIIGFIRMGLRMYPQRFRGTTFQSKPCVSSIIYTMSNIKRVPRKEAPYPA